MGPNQVNGSQGTEQNQSEPPPITESSVQAQDPGHASEQTPNLVFKGKTVALNEVQEILKSFEDIERDRGRQAGELGYMREKLAKLEGVLSTFNKPQAEPEQEPDYESGFFESPNKFLTTFEKNILNKARELVQSELSHKEKEYTARQTQEKTAQQAWDSFYEQNPQLKPLRNDVMAVITEKLRSEISHLPIEEAFTRIAAEGKKRLIELARAGSFNANTSPSNSGYSEPANKGNAGGGALPKDPMTIKDLQRDLIDANNSLRNKLIGRSSVI